MIFWLFIILITKNICFRAGHAAQVRWIHLCPPCQPHHDRRSRSVFLSEITLRVGVWVTRAIGSTSVGQLLIARAYPHVTHTHREYDEDNVEPELVAVGDVLVTKSFFFGPDEIAAIRRLLPHGLHSTTFDALTSFLWRCRTVAMSPDPNTEMRMTCIINARSKLRNPPIPFRLLWKRFCNSCGNSHRKRSDGETARVSSEVDTRGEV